MPQVCLARCLSILKQPFFLIGSPRAGTTLLRNVLRTHSSLICPEETHFFRWAFPFHSEEFLETVQNDPTLRSHRDIDGVSEQDFVTVYQRSDSRRTLQDAYVTMTSAWKASQTSRWFDKTPQNVYGMLLLSGMYPESKFIHLHRHPLNVVASLKAGVVMPPHSVLAGINMWLEAVTIVQEYEKAWPERLLNVSYERFTENPRVELERILEFIEEPWEEQLLDGPKIHPEQNKYMEELTEEEVALVKTMLGDKMAPYGYS